MIDRFLILFSTIYSNIKLLYLSRKKGFTIEIGKGVIFFGNPIFQIHSKSRIKIGKRAIFRSSSKWNALGINHPCIVSTFSQKAKIEIGDDVGLSGVSICAIKSIYIGDKSLIGANSKIMDTDFHPISPINRLTAKIDIADSANVYIGNNVLIGANSLILKGVTIGDNSVIGAGSVVTRDIPPGVVAAGNPCKIIRQIND